MWKMKRLLTITLALPAFLLLFCPLPLHGAEKPRIGVLLYRQDDIYISMVSSAVQNVLRGDAEVRVLSAGSDQFTQTEQVESLLAEGVNALAVNLVDTQAAAMIAGKAKKAGVPVIFFNREPDLDSIGVYAGHTCFVGTQIEDAGRMQGGLIKKLWDAHPEYDRNKDGRFQYLMFQANTDNPEAVARTEFSVRTALELGVPMAQLGDSLMCEWDENLAREAMLLALSLHGEAVVELVIANNDSMALGAISALNAHGYNSGDKTRFIPVVGVDAIPAAVAAIQEGAMSATVKQDAEGMGRAVAIMSLNAARGVDMLTGTALEWDSSGIAVRIPYAPYEGARD